MNCGEIHGDSGLDGPSITLPPGHQGTLPGKAVNVMFAAISERWAARRGEEGGEDARVDLVCTGALTNAALLLSVYPEIVHMIRLTLMVRSRALFWGGRPKFLGVAVGCMMRPTRS